MTQAIETLGQLFAQMQVNVRYYDLGRRVEKLSKEQFQSFEELRKPYPRPHLQHALIGVVFWQQHTIAQPSVWCLRLPLDEQGLLIPSERDRFLQHLLMAVNNNLNAEKKQQQLSAVLEGNPYTFTPPQEKQAAFNAKIKVSLKLPASQYLAPTLDYLHGSDYSQWQTVALQGLADLTARWQQPECHQALLHALPYVPTSVLISLCQCLENETIDAAITEVLLQRINHTLSANNSDNSSEKNATLAACLRGLSFSVAATHVQTAVDSILHGSTPDDTVDIEIIATLATRLAPQLINGGNPLVFMELLAQHSEQAFIGVMSEILYQPDIREPFLSGMRLPDRSETLSKAIGALLQPSHAVH